MKELILMRHASASWGEPGCSDHERPLSPQGEAEARGVAERLGRLDPPPQLLVSSPARRAEQTARAVFEALDLPAERWQREAGIYEASTKALIQLLHRMDDAVERIVWVGHNPGFHDLARALSPEPPRGLPPAGTVHLRFDVESWMSVDDTPAVSTRFSPPPAPRF